MSNARGLRGEKMKPSEISVKCVKYTDTDSLARRHSLNHGILILAILYEEDASWPTIA
jgi:hypothetical protein